METNKKILKGLKRRSKKSITTIEVNKFYITDTLYVVETITNGDCVYNLETTLTKPFHGENIRLRPIYVKDSYFELFKKCCPYSRYEQFKDQYEELPDDLNDIDTSRILLSCSYSHQTFDIEGNDIGKTFYFDYINGAYNNHRYNLVGLKKYLESLDYAYDVDIEDIPYHSRDEYRKEGISAKVFFTGDQISEIQKFGKGNRVDSLLTSEDCGLDFFDIDQFKLYPKTN